MIAANAPIEDLDLGIRAYNRLRHAGIRTVADLASNTERQLLELPGVEWKQVDEINVKLRMNGRSLVPEPK